MQGRKRDIRTPGKQRLLHHVSCFSSHWLHPKNNAFLEIADLGVDRAVLIDKSLAVNLQFVRSALRDPDCKFSPRISVSLPAIFSFTRSAQADFDSGKSIGRISEDCPLQQEIMRMARFFGR